MLVPEPVPDDELSESGSMESSDSADPWASTSNGATPMSTEGPGLRSPPRDTYVVGGEASRDISQQAVNQQAPSSQSFVSTVAPSLPVPSNPPSAADWNAYRPIFTEHYITEGKTLKDTMQIMAERYGFEATERMFKKRAADWKLRKYHPRKSSGSTTDQPVAPAVSIRNSRRGDTTTQPQSVSPNNRANRTAVGKRPTRRLGSSSSDQDTPDSQEDIVSSSYTQSTHRLTHTINQTQAEPSTFNQTQAEPSNLLVRRTPARMTRRAWRPSKNHDAEIETYLRKQQPNLSLTQFRTISQDLEIVEAILDLTHQYYDSFTDVQWARKFPSSPRTVMKEMPLCIDLGTAFPRGQETPIHPTQIFGRYMVAFELLKSRKQSDIDEGWRLIHEAFDLFKPILAQQHTQLLRYFFQQIYDYRLNDHPEIRKRIFELAEGMAVQELGPKHPITQICRLLPQVEDKDTICVLGWRKSLELIDRNLGEGSDDSLRSKLSLTGDLIEQSKFAEAENLLKQMLRAPGRQPTDYYMRSTLLRLAWLYRLRGRHFDAENSLYELLRRCNECSSNGGEVPDAIAIAAQTNLAQSLCSRGELEDGCIVLQGALNSCIRTFGPQHGYTTSVADELEKITNSMANIHIE